jgi:hypothetical protein
LKRFRPPGRKTQGITASIPISRDGLRTWCAPFNRLVIDLWHRRELGCLSLDRQEFASRLEQRGWHYNPETHLWTKREATQSVSQELALFGV